MRFLKWLWTDDHSHEFSGTTLRTWIAFILAVVCIVYWVFFDKNGIKYEEEMLLQTLTFFYLGQGTLFAAKRFNEVRSTKSYDSRIDEVEKNLRERGL